jgi:hypothetical protein
MRWAVVLLLIGNLALFAYTALIDRGSSTVPDVHALELNAEKVKHLNGPAAQRQRAACLEWHNLEAADLKRAQDELGKLKPRKMRVRNGVIVIVEPESALVARIAELKAGFAGTELKAVICPDGTS